MKSKKSKEETFTKVPDTILASDKLTPSQKLVISYVLRWQSSGMVCFESNNSLAKKFGVSLSGIKKQITQLNRLPFFLSKETSKRNENGKWSNSKKMEVDEEKLKEYLKVSELVVGKEKEVLYDSYEDFVSCAKEITSGEATDEFIKFCYDKMPKFNMPRTMKFMLRAFERYIPPPPPPA